MCEPSLALACPSSLPRRGPGVAPSRVISTARPPRPAKPLRRLSNGRTRSRVSGAARRSRASRPTGHRCRRRHDVYGGPQEIPRPCRASRRPHAAPRCHRPTGAEAAGQRVRRAVVERPPRAADVLRRQGALELFDTAERRAEDDGDPLRLGGDRGAREQVLGRGEQELRGATSHPARAGQGAKLLDLAAAPHPEIVDGKALDRRDAVAAGDEPRPERVEVGAERSHGSGSDEVDGLSAQARYSS